MMSEVSTEITFLLKAWAGGEQEALHRLVPKVYGELCRMARRYMRKERDGNTLQSKALVNEVYLRLIHVDHVNWQDRAHFFGVASQMMRRILVDAARVRTSGKRGGHVKHVQHAKSINLDQIPDMSNNRDRELIAIDEALKALTEIDPRKGRIIELRFFGGLTAKEAAEVLNVSEPTVLRDWKLAKAWLMRELSRSDVDKLTH